MYRHQLHVYAEVKRNLQISICGSSVASPRDLSECIVIVAGGRVGGRGKILLPANDVTAHGLEYTRHRGAVRSVNLKHIGAVGQRWVGDGCNNWDARGHRFGRIGHRSRGEGYGTADRDCGWSGIGGGNMIRCRDGTERATCRAAASGCPRHLGVFGYIICYLSAEWSRNTCRTRCGYS